MAPRAPTTAAASGEARAAARNGQGTDDGPVLTALCYPERQRLGRERFHEVPVVGDEQYPAGESFERVEEHVLGLYIEVVGRLVQNEQVVVPEDDPGQQHLCPLPRAQPLHRLVDGLP